METQASLIDFCEDIIAEILSRISLKPRTKLKLVSKNWCVIITRIRLSNPPTTSTGLGLLLRPIDRAMRRKTYQATLHIKQDQCRECIPQDPHPINNTYASLLSSCNGLLLYFLYDGVFCVSNPTLKKFQLLESPRVIMNGFASASIFFDGSSQEHFKVMCNFWDKWNPTTIKCYLYNSETQDWSVHEARIVNPSAVPKNGLYWYPYTILSQGKFVYSRSNRTMVVYNFERQVFKAVKLPVAPESDFFFDGYWESDGCLFYCQSRYEGLDIFTYAGDDDDPAEDNNADQKMMWKRRIIREELIGNAIDEVNENDDDEEEEEEDDDGDVKFYDEFLYSPIPQLITFNEDLQMLYLHMKGAIYCYSFETGSSTRVPIQLPVFKDGSKTVDLRLHGVFFPYNFGAGRKARLLDLTGGRSRINCISWVERTCYRLNGILEFCDRFNACVQQLHKLNDCRLNGILEFCDGLNECLQHLHILNKCLPQLHKTWGAICKTWGAICRTKMWPQCFCGLNFKKMLYNSLAWVRR